MDPQVRTSFIPKKPVTAAYAERRSPVGIFLIVSIALFLGSFLAAGGVFGYLSYLKQSIASKSESLERSQKAFEPAVIEELVRLDSRMKLGQEVLSSHVAPSAIFSFLEQTTLASVRFRDFEYALDGSGNAQISLSGQARTFSDVALQSDEFGKQQVLKDLFFDGINTDQVGNVVFSVHASLAPNALSYTGENAPVPAPSPETQTP